MQGKRCAWNDDRVIKQTFGMMNLPVNKQTAGNVQ